MIYTRQEYDEILNGAPALLSPEIKSGDSTHIDDHITIARLIFGPNQIIEQRPVYKLIRYGEEEWNVISYDGAGEENSATYPHSAVIEYWSDLLPLEYMQMNVVIESQKGLTELPPDDWPIGSSVEFSVGGFLEAIMHAKGFIDHNPANLNVNAIWGMLIRIGNIQYHYCYTDGTWSPPLPDEASTQREFWNGHNLLINSSSISAPKAGDKIWSIIPRSTDQTRIADLEARIAALEANTP